MTTNRSVDDLLARLRDALAHLYDYTRLLNHPLADDLGLPTQLAPRERMRQLRSTLIGGIEQLRPAGDTVLRSPKSRSYQVLSLHYVESMLIDEVARELAVSTRQVYRDLRRAEDDLTAILGLTGSADSPDISETSGPESHLSGEAALVAASGGSVPVVTMLCGACEAVQALAQAKGLRLDFVSEGAVEAQGLEVGELARHALISLISLTTKSAKPGSTVRVESTLAQEVVNVAISFSCEAHPSAESLGTALKLLNLVNAELTKSESKAGCVLTVRLPTIRRTRVLLVDDNADLAGLFERFLRETRYALSVARDAETGLAMAAQCEAEIIVLDVMMSGRDGWSLLQQLSNSGSACSLPVVICSAIHDPELAMSLGAVASLTKPVTRMELLRALETAERRTAASPQ